MAATFANTFQEALQMTPIFVIRSMVYSCNYSETALNTSRRGSFSVLPVDALPFALVWFATSYNRRRPKFLSWTWLVAKAH